MSDPIFSRMPLDILSQLARTVTFDPLVNTTPAKLLSSLSEAERAKWLDAHRDELEDHLSFVGSSVVSYALGNGKSYREIVIEMAQKLAAFHREQDSTATIERSIIGKVWDDTVARLTPEQREELLAQTEALAAKYGVSLGKEMTGFAALTAAQLSGFGVYLLGSTLLGAINGVLGLGLGFGAFTGLSSLISTVIGPIGWAALGFFTILKLGGPNYKKLLPAIILIATARAAEDPGILPKSINPASEAASKALLTSTSEQKRQQPLVRDSFERSQVSGSALANPVIRELQWEVLQVTNRHSGQRQRSDRPATLIVRRPTRHEKTVFDLKNRNLRLFTESLVPGVHYLDLEADDKALVDELYAQRQSIEAEAQHERDRVNKIQEEHRKRERRLRHKGKLQKVSEESKQNFDKEFPRLAEIAASLDGNRHYLEFSSNEQSLIKELEAEERESKAQDAEQRKRLAELEVQYAYSSAEKAKREQPKVAPMPSVNKIDRTRKNYGELFPTFVFSDRALERLRSFDEGELGDYYRQFRLMADGKSNGKHEVPLTDPKIWSLDAGNSGKVYYRRDEGNRFVVELVGCKNGQEADYTWLRNKS